MESFASDLLNSELSSILKSFSNDITDIRLKSFNNESKIYNINYDGADYKLYREENDNNITLMLIPNEYELFEDDFKDTIVLNAERNSIRYTTFRKVNGFYKAYDYILNKENRNTVFSTLSEYELEDEDNLIKEVYSHSKLSIVEFIKSNRFLVGKKVSESMINRDMNSTKQKVVYDSDDYMLEEFDFKRNIRDYNDIDNEDSFMNLHIIGLEENRKNKTL